MEPGSPHVQSARLKAIEAWSRAGLGTGTWNDALQATARGIGVETAVLFSPAESLSAGEVNAMIGAAEGMMPLYASAWAHRDPWTLAARTTGLFDRAGFAKLGRLAVPHKDLLKTDFYNEFGRHWGGEDIACLKVCDASDALAVETHLSFFRGGGQPLFEDWATDYLMSLWPHIQRAVHSHYRLSREGGRDLAKPDLLELVPTGIFIFRANGWIDYMNPAASRLLQEMKVPMTNSRRLDDLPGLEPGRLQAWLRAGIQGMGCDASCTTSFQGRAIRLKWSSLPLANDPAFSAVWPNACLFVAVEKMDVTAQVRGLLQDFAVRYRFTQRESDVLARLIEGRDLPGIAEHLDIGHATVRTHMASMLAKTRCSRQAELIARVLGLA